VGEIDPASTTTSLADRHLPLSGPSSWRGVEPTHRSI